jgi:2-phosphoglycolate phosphatase
MISTVLFDLDGTLVDSAPDLAAALNLQLERHQQPPVPYQMLRPHASSGARGMLKLGFGVGPGSPDYDELKREYLELYECNLLGRTQLFPGVPNLVLAITSSGLGWGIVTNKAQYLTTPLLGQLMSGLQPGCVVCGDSTPFIKPHPEPLLEAARRLSVPPDHCLYVGDDERDILSARAAGMRSVAATYGYLGVARAPEEWGADYLISTPLDLLNLLSNAPHKLR